MTRPGIEPRSPGPLNVSTVSMSKTVLFSIRIWFTSIWPIDWTLSGATTPGQNEPGSDGIPQSSSITGTSPLDCLVSYSELTWVSVCVCVWGGSYPSAELQSVYSTVPANWAIEYLCYFNICIWVIFNSPTPHKKSKIIKRKKSLY